MTEINKFKTEAFKECEDLLLEMAQDAEDCICELNRPDATPILTAKAEGYRRVAGIISDRRECLEKKV